VTARGFAPALALVLVAVSAGAGAEPVGKRRTAVLDPKFSDGVDAGGLKPLGGLLAVAVQRHSQGEVTSAEDVRTMIGFEREKTLLGCNDTSCLAEIGGALGVDELVTTEVGKLGSQLVVNLARIDIRKARAVTRTSRQVADVDALVAALDGAVAELYGGAAPPPAVVEEEEGVRVAPWVTTGLGVLALGVGGLLYGDALAGADEPLLQDEADALEGRGNTGLGLALGGAALAAGGVLWLVSE